MKRRRFFTWLAAGAAAIVAGFPILRALPRTVPAAREPKRKIQVTINPLAVPRAPKGESHG